mgnify:CR=1 FL=1
MSIASYLAADHPTAFSIEVLPPVRGKGIEQVFKTIDRLMPFNPAYINITNPNKKPIAIAIPPHIELVALQIIPANNTPIPITISPIPDSLQNAFLFSSATLS